MNVRELLKADFGVDLPIKGGLGNSINNPVIIEKTRMNDYVSTEYTYLKYIGMGRGVQWKVINQELFTHEGRTLDKIKIETIEQTPDEIITQIENYYFDITECFGK